MVGTSAITSEVDDGGPTPSPPSDTGNFTPIGDAVAPRGDDDDGDASKTPCVSDGGFCDLCDRALVLCIQFDGGAVDESRFHRPLAFEGGAPKYIRDKGFGALSLDGKVFVIVPAGDGLDDVNAITAEFFARVKRPPEQARITFYDGNAIGSFFLYGGDAGGPPHLRCNNTDVDAGKINDEWTHYTCVSRTLQDAGGAISIYVDGGRLNGSNLPASAPTASKEQIFLFADHPSGTKDGLVGDVASVRIYRRAKDDDAVRKAANP